MVRAAQSRWQIAAAAVAFHLMIGSAYAWSVFTKPLMAQFGWSQKEVSLAFSIAIFALGMSAAFMGRFVERHGPRKSGTLAAIFFGVGVAGSGLAVLLESLWLLYLFYGLIGGIGLGIGYITPVSTLVKWFPDRRGLATGLAIMGFGFASLVSGPAAAVLIERVGIAATFGLLGAVYFAVMLGAAQVLTPPPPDWMPPRFAVQAGGSGQRLPVDLAQLTANEAIKTRRFWFLWVMLFINVTCGIAIISVASPMGQEIAGLSPIAAASMVGIMGLFNGIGRIGWASLSDYIGRPNVFTAFFLLQIGAFLLLPNAHEALLFQVLVFAIMTCYGGGFATLPAYIGDLFGTKELGAIHGYLLTAWAMAGVVGPILVSSVYDATKSYAGTLAIFAALFAVALAVSLWIRADIKALRAQQQVTGASITQSMSS